MAGSLAEPIVVGVSHRSGTAALRERLFLDESGQAALLGRLQAAGLTQALVLSTCDRTEVHAVDGDTARAAAIIREALAAMGRVAAAEILTQGYEHAGRAALRHLFAVAASLDSVVIGEPQVLGQLKDSHRLAAAAGAVGSDLDGILRAAYGAAKRVRSETAIGERPVSIAAAAIQMARRVQGDLDRCTAVLLGGGEMGELMAEQLRQAGIARMVVVHRSMPRAALIAHRLGAHVRPYADLAAALAEADILVCAVGDEQETVMAAAIQAALRARRQRPIMCIDAAVPGDIDEAVDRLDGAFLFDLGDLERLAVEGQSSRTAAAAAAWAIVDAEVAAFASGEAGRHAAPAVVALRRHFEAIREQVMAENPAADAATATRLLLNRLLHAPSAALREAAANAAVDGAGELVEIERVLARVFGAGVDDARPQSVAGQETEEDA
jgi:glutamyl-tRNA reductase